MEKCNKKYFSKHVGRETQKDEEAHQQHTEDYFFYPYCLTQRTPQPNFFQHKYTTTTHISV